MRTWKGAVRAHDASAYLAHQAGTGVQAYREAPGNRGAMALRRAAGDRVEVLTVSFWDGWDAVRGFAGEEPGRAVFYPGDGDLLVARDEHVDHWEVVSSDLDAGAASVDPQEDPWAGRIAAAWGAIGAASDEATARAQVDAAVAELPRDDPRAVVARAGAWDSTGHPDRAVEGYRAALAAGLEGPLQRQATIQLASSLRNLGRPEEAEALLQEAVVVDDAWSGAIRAVLALVLADLGREREGLALALEALVPSLPRYHRSMSAYAAALRDG